MTLTHDTKTKLEESLYKSITDLTSKKMTQYTSSTNQSDDTHKPFHEKLLSKDLLRATDFERSFSTLLGSIFENCAYIIASARFDYVQRQHKLSGFIPSDSIAEVNKIIDEIGKKKRFPNYQREVDRLVDLVKKDTSNKISRDVTSDLYVVAIDGTETFFEMKSPKPNKEQCLQVTQKHLWIHCIQKAGFPKTQTRFAMAYNPYGDGVAYKHSFSKTYLDTERHALIGRDLWDFLGGRGAYDDLLDIYHKVGHDMNCKDLIKKVISS